MENINIYKNPTCELFNNSSIVFNKNSYIVSLNNKIIGHFNLLIRQNKILIEYELLEQYRGLGLGNDFYQIIEQYVENNFDYDEIVLLIRYDNDRSIKIATKNNYKINYTYVEEMATYGEMTMFNPFVKVKKIS